MAILSCVAQLHSSPIGKSFTTHLLAFADIRNQHDSLYTEKVCAHARPRDSRRWPQANPSGTWYIRVPVFPSDHGGLLGVYWLAGLP